MSNNYIPQTGPGFNSPKGAPPFDAPLFGYFRKYLAQKIASVFEFGYPEGWTRDQIRHFIRTLIMVGYVGFFETKKFGLVALEGHWTGINLFYGPKSFLVCNPLLAGVEKTIGKDCVLFTLQETPSFRHEFTPADTSALDIINYFASQMSLATQALNSNLVNSQLAYVFTTDNKASSESFKKMFEQIASGEPVVVQDKNLLREDGTPGWQAFQQNLRQTYIANDILQTLNEIEDQFNSLVGIPNANTEKKERLIVDEVNANNVETTCLSDLWLENMKRCCEEVNEMFGVNMTVKKRYDMEEINDGEEDPENEISDT